MNDLKKAGFNREEIESLRQEAEEYLLDMFKTSPSIDQLDPFIENGVWDNWVDQIAAILAERAKLVATDAIISAIDEVDDDDVYEDWISFGDPIEDHDYPTMRAYHHIWEGISNLMSSDYAGHVPFSKGTLRKFGF